MSSEALVARLRAYRTFDEWSDQPVTHSICTEAAARITDLEAQLATACADERKAVVEWLRDRTNHRHPDFAFADVFAAAIEQGKHVKGEE